MFKFCQIPKTKYKFIFFFFCFLSSNVCSTSIKQKKSNLKHNISGKNKSLELKSKAADLIEKNKKSIASKDINEKIKNSKVNETMEFNNNLQISYEILSKGKCNNPPKYAIQSKSDNHLFLTSHISKKINFVHTEDNKIFNKELEVKKISFDEMLNFIQDLQDKKQKNNFIHDKEYHNLSSQFYKLKKNIEISELSDIMTNSRAHNYLVSEFFSLRHEGFVFSELVEIIRKTWIFGSCMRNRFKINLNTIHSNTNNDSEINNIEISDFYYMDFNRERFHYNKLTSYIDTTCNFKKACTDYNESIQNQLHNFPLSSFLSDPKFLMENKNIYLFNDKIIDVISNFDKLQSETQLNEFI